MKNPLLKKFNLKKAAAILPTRKNSDNKSVAGKTLIIAGSKGMYGAGILAATAAARVGSGYVYLMSDKKQFNSLKHPDFLIVDRKKKNSFHGISAIAIGPGLGTSSSSVRLLNWLIKENETNVVVDADAINILSTQKTKPLPSSWIITPHEGELSRLLKKSSSWIRSNRIEAAKRTQKKLGCLVLLKGSRTLLATHSELFEIQSGNPTLAKAGTGDVLTGMITGFLAQGMTSKEAALLGAFVHGKLADDWIANKKDVLSLLPSDLISLLPKTLYKIRSKR